ncbi:MAG: M48 family metallopeptidase [Alphaproteobacteria bacterium]|nr:M48 family metallopeptidase [Alphaproteobacteria bacterium]
MINLLGRIAMLRSLPAAPEPCVLEVDGRPVKLSFKRNVRCKRMIMRLAKDGTGLVMTLPKRTSQAEAHRFALASKDWIRKNLANRMVATEFGDGVLVPLRGELWRISCPGGRRGLVQQDHEAKTLIVPGDLAHVNRRLTDWLKQQALQDLTRASHHCATAMNVKFSAITVRDQSSRWGSCSHARALSYSWRLILAPSYVLDYVAAHEVAHLQEMNHGPRFWRLVLTHCKTAKQARHWLKTEARDLHRYGVKTP